MPRKQPEQTKAVPTTSEDCSDPAEDAGTKFDRFTELLERVVRTPPPGRGDEEEKGPGKSRPQDD